MKKGFILMETVLALALFIAIALPLFYLSLEGKTVAHYTQQKEKSSDALSNSLEMLYSGAYTTLVEQVESLGWVEDDYQHLGMLFRRKWEHLNPQEQGAPLQLRLTLTWQDRNERQYETSLDFIYHPKERLHPS